MPGDPMATLKSDLVALDYGDLDGWASDDHAAAFAAFRRSAEHMVTQAPHDGALGVRGADLQRIAAEALRLSDPHGRDARDFFESRFRPVAVRPNAGAFLTGYFEPEVAGSLSPTDEFRYPLYARPADLVNVTHANRPAGWDPTYAFARKTASGLVPYYDRGEIDDGALTGRNLELVFLADPIDAFFVHVQGSASIRLADHRRMRVAYAAKAGHPYTSIGQRLIERGCLSPDTMTLDALRAWLRAHPSEGAALLRENRSYVFFQELSGTLDPELGAVAAGGVQITPGRSLAIDHHLHAYGTPIWLTAALPIGVDGAMEPVRRLLIAQDTGSAIVGPARGDMFFGLGGSAGKLAGRIRHAPDAFVMLQPR